MAAWAKAEFLKTRMKEIRRKTWPQPSRLEKKLSQTYNCQSYLSEGRTDR